MRIISETNKKKPENLLKVFGCDSDTIDSFFFVMVRLFCYLPAVDPSGLCREVGTYFIYMTAVVLEGLGVLFVVNLLQGLVSGLVKFELNNIDVV